MASSSHFAAKDDLILALIARLIDSTAECMGSHLLAAEPAKFPEKFIAAYISTWVEYYRTHARDVLALVRVYNSFRDESSRPNPAFDVRAEDVAAVAGLVLRGWSFKTLGDYFTFTVIVSTGQPVVTAGPYGLLRHPSYTGILLAGAGIGLVSANWVGLASVTLLPLTSILWRIRIEENALLTMLGERYRTYASAHKRLLPLVW